jgi:hypothetical protein
MKPDEDLLKDVRTWFSRAKDHSLEWRNESKENYDFFSGRQWSDDELAELEEQLRPPIAFNRIAPMVSAVKGHQINNRQEVRYIPRELGDVQVNELLTGAAQWVDDECDAEDELSEVFEDLIITGMGWSETRLSYDEDIDGKIHSIERVSPLEMYWDQSSKRRNLADARYVMRGRWMSRRDAEQKWPELKNIEPGNDEYLWAEEEGELKPHDASRAHFYENDARQWYNKHRDEVFIVQVQWWEHEPMYRIGDPQTGRLLELSDAKFNRMKDQLDMMGVPYVRQLKKKFFQSFVTGPVILEKGDCPCPDHFTLRCVTGKRDAMKGFWFGLVRGMVDPQRWGNKFFSDIQDMLVSNRQGGAFVEQSALIDPRQAEEIWNDPNPLIQVQDGSLARGAIQERSPIPYPQGLDRMMEWAVNALPAVTGINLEMMGFANRDQPNVLEVQRKRSALNVLADLFDSLRKFNKERGRVVLYFIQNYINDGRLIRITGQDGMEQFVPLALDPEQTKYDVIVDEASSSPNQKEETFAVMMQLMPLLMQAGVAPPPELLEYLPLPSSLVAGWKQQLMPDEQQPDPMQELQMQGAQAEIAKLFEEIKEIQSKTQANMAKASRDEKDAEAQGIQNMAVSMGLMEADEL